MPQIRNNPVRVIQIRGLIRVRNIAGLQLVTGFITRSREALGLLDGSAIGRKRRLNGLVERGSSAAYRTTQNINTFIARAEKGLNTVDQNNATRF